MLICGNFFGMSFQNNLFFFVLNKGKGYLTFKVKHIHAHNEIDSESVSANCDPYVEVFINDELVHESEPLEDTNVFNLDSNLISKSTKIRIEVWDQDSGFRGDDDSIQTTEGDIESIMKEPVEEQQWIQGYQNFIETAKFWQDEYEELALKISKDECGNYLLIKEMLLEM